MRSKRRFMNGKRLRRRSPIRHGETNVNPGNPDRDFKEVELPKFEGIFGVSSKYLSKENILKDFEKQPTISW